MSRDEAIQEAGAMAHHLVDRFGITREEILTAAGAHAANIMTLSLAEAGRQLHLTRDAIRRSMPVVNHGNRNQVVRVVDCLELIKSRTEYPKKS